MQRQLSLLELDPLGKYIIILVNGIRELGHIGITTLTFLLILPTVFELLHLMDHPVDQRCDTVHQEELRTVLFMSFLTIVNQVLTDSSGFIQFFI